MITAFQWDLGRQVEKIDWLVAQLPRYADWGYKELYLHLEDAVDFPSLPGVARKDAYSRKQFARLVDAATLAGIHVVPIVNLLGHTQYLIKVPGLRDLNELRAPDGSPLEKGQVCPLHPRILDVADALVRDMAPFCTAGKIHVGLDESFSLGRHPLSKAEIDKIGLGRHFAGYVGRLNQVVGARGLRLGMWADMLPLVPEAIAHLPEGIIAYDWYYYPFTGRPRMELRNFAEYDLAPALKARGIEYWGCPMNGSFRHEPLPVFGERLANLRDWWRRCNQVKAAGFLVTSWEPNRLAMPMTTVVDAAAASLWLDPGLDNDTGMLGKGMTRVFGGTKGRELARSALSCDSRAFAGNSRWEINERWDTVVTRRGTAKLEAERTFYARLSRESLPLPFRASVAFRRYIAERDVYVRSVSALVFSLRRRLAKKGAADPKLSRSLELMQGHADQFVSTVHEGIIAAREVWRLTRDASVKGPNEKTLAADAARLKALRAWIVRARANPSRVVAPCPVCGQWQLTFDYVVTEPALQRLVVEARGVMGGWETLHARTLIEFRAESARPNTRQRREFSVPVPTRGTALRISLRGIGRVGITQIELSDGVTILRPRRWPSSRIHILGTKAPKSGFPDLEWGRNNASVVLDFRA